ncbi:hypothetical protein BDP67DRAFT_535203 [Colletotrichum lupini]|nr:hypothetical protein BDP67DRAFT_535203 [Colletotrichum lupini]
MASGFTGELTLLRVNQVWIWTIGNKWLLTATSCLFSKCHGTLVEGILDQLSKQAKYGGRKSQPSSAVEMAKLIADYCIGSYERRPNSEIQPHKPPIDTVPSGSSKPVIGQQLSISQIYSNHMNQIGRAETALYNSFKYRERLQNEQDGLDSRVSKLLREWEAARISSNMEVAINKAEKLYSDIKDVRDELNILKSVAQYQQSVQRKLTPSQVKNADLTAAQVVSNIIELDVVADRIQLAVNATISLQQNEIANNQAKLAWDQARLAVRQGELAGKQSKVLVVFTFATLLFLPLSFLSSLFALDVSSFLQTPTWAYLVIFLVSSVVSLIIGLVAFFSETIKKYGKKTWKHVRRPKTYGPIC